jgi:hypothetical protein
MYIVRVYGETGVHTVSTTALLSFYWRALLKKKHSESFRYMILSGYVYGNDQYNAIPYNTIQYIAIQYDTIPYTARYSATGSGASKHAR